MEPCLEFMDHLTFFLNGYSGKKSESDVIAECLIKYRFHFFVFIKYSNFPFSSEILISPIFNKRIILSRSCFITVQIVYAITGAPVRRLQINLGFGSFLKVCSFIQSLAYGNDRVSNAGSSLSLLHEESHLHHLRYSYLKMSLKKLFQGL